MFILHIPHHLLSSGLTRQFNLRRESSAGRPFGAPFVLSGYPSYVLEPMFRIGSFYLDDGTIGGDVVELSQDLDVVVRMSAEPE